MTTESAEPAEAPSITDGSPSAQVPAPSAPSRRPVDAVALALLCVVVLVGLWRLFVMSGWSWFQDDWVYMTSATGAPFLEYVSQSYNGHLMPAQFALFWAWVQWAPLDYAWAVATVWLLGMAALVAWVLAFRRLLGSRPATVALAVVVGLSPVFLPASLWTAAGLQTFSLQLALALSALSTALWFERATWPRLLAVYGSLLLGLIFWEKALLVVIPATGLALFLAQRRGHRWRSRRVLAPIGGMAVIAAAYLAVYLGATAVDASERPAGAVRSFAQIVEFLRVGLLGNALPALAGGPWAAQETILTGSVQPPTWVQWVLLGLMIAVIALSLAYRRGAGWMVATGALYVAVSWGLLLFSSRYDVVGVLGILDSRYSADSVSVLALCAGLMALPLRGEPVRSAYRIGLPDAVMRGQRRWSWLLAGALAISCLVTAGTVWDRVSLASPKPWVDQAVPAMRLAGSGVVFDSNAPAPVALAWAFPEEARLSALMAPLRLPVRYDEPGDSMFALDDQGRLTAGVFGDSITAVPGPIARCGYLVKPGETAFVPLTEKAFAWNWGLTVRYLSAAGGELLVRTDKAVTRIPLEPGVGTKVAVVVDSATSVRLSSSPGSGAICVDYLAIGLVSPGALIPASTSASGA